MQILFLFPLTISSVALFHPSPQPARECVAEAVQAAILIVAILVTLSPHRGALTLLSILTIFLVNIVLEPRAADVVARLIGAVDHRDDERGAEATPGTPPLHPALQALVTDANEEEFLAELARWPTELEAAEAADTAEDGGMDEVISGTNGSPSPRGAKSPTANKLW